MHPLENVLLIQLGSDRVAVLSLPSVISALTPAHFQPSPHLQKWISRLTSLIHSKHPGARWAGLCLALQTSILNKDLMMESAQNWTAVTLPMLSRNEAPPTWKACIRLLGHLFSSAAGMPEFQRQLATPNVPKLGTALVGLVEKCQDYEIRHISLVTLTSLIPLYPTLYRQLHSSLCTLSFRLLSGSSTSPTPLECVTDVCSLHAVLHYTGGKVGAAPLWRKSFDTALANAWSAFVTLRTTFPRFPRPTLSIQPTFDAAPTDPALAIPLSLDRLKCSIALLKSLLSAVTSRPVLVPVGQLNSLTACLLRCNQYETLETHFDTARRALETSIVPEIWKLGCALVSQMAKTLRHYLNPHLSRIVSQVTHHLEQPLSKSHRIIFIRVLVPLLSHTYALHSTIPPTRLVKSLIPDLSTLLSSKSDVGHQLQEASFLGSKKGKKRARGYEGDEVFKVGRDVLCPAPEDREIVEVVLDALDSLLLNPNLSVPVRTLSARLLVTLLIELPRYASLALSPDLSFHGRIYSKVLSVCRKHVLTGASGWINSAAGLVINTVGGIIDGSETVMNSAMDAQRELDVLLHPRLPPLLRSLPPIEAVALFRSENNKDDKAARDLLGLSTMEEFQSTAGLTATITPQDSRQHINAIAHAQEQQSTATDIATTANITTTITPPIFSPKSSTSVSAPFVTTSVSITPGRPGTESLLPSIPITSTLDTSASIAIPESSEPSQLLVPSTTSFREPYKISKNQNNDEDEDMPEIDTGSDSD